MNISFHVIDIIGDTMGVSMGDISNNSQENFEPVPTSPFFEECIQANFSNLDYPKLLNVTKVAHYVWFSWFGSHLKMSKNVFGWMHDYLKD